MDKLKKNKKQVEPEITATGVLSCKKNNAAYTSINKGGRISSLLS